MVKTWPKLSRSIFGNRFYIITRYRKDKRGFDIASIKYDVTKEMHIFILSALLNQTNGLCLFCGSKATMEQAITRDLPKPEEPDIDNTDNSDNQDKDPKETINAIVIRTCDSCQAVPENEE